MHVWGRGSLGIPLHDYPYVLADLRSLVLRLALGDVGHRRPVEVHRQRRCRLVVVFAPQRRTNQKRALPCHPVLIRASNRTYVGRSGQAAVVCDGPNLLSETRATNAEPYLEYRASLGPPGRHDAWAFALPVGDCNGYRMTQLLVRVPRRTPRNPLHLPSRDLLHGGGLEKTDCDRRSCVAEGHETYQVMSKVSRLGRTTTSGFERRVEPNPSHATPERRPTPRIEGAACVPNTVVESFALIGMAVRCRVLGGTGNLTRTKRSIPRVKGGWTDRDAAQVRMLEPVLRTRNTPLLRGVCGPFLTILRGRFLGRGPTCTREKAQSPESTVGDVAGHLPCVPSGNILANTVLFVRLWEWQGLSSPRYSHVTLAFPHDRLPPLACGVAVP